MCYILLITCAVARAVHIEVTPDVGSYSLKLALIRFFSRRGVSKLVISDNFKGAVSGLRRCLANKSSLKMMKNVFYFTLKALFVLKMFKF